MGENLQETLLREIRLLLLPLAEAAESDFRGELLSDVTGWSLKAGSDPATDHSLIEFVDAYDRLDDLIEKQPETLTDVLEVLDNVTQMISAVRRVSVQPGGGDGQVLEELGKDLIAALVVGYLKVWHPVVYDILVVLTVIRPPADISLKRISDLLGDPENVLSAEYLRPQGLITAEDARSLADKLFPRLAALLVDFGVQAVYGVKPENGLDLGELGNHLGAGMLTIFLQPDFEAGDRYSVTLALSPRDLGNLGLVVIPFGKILPYRNVSVDLTAAAAGFAIGPQGLKMLGTSDKAGVSLHPSVKLPGLLIGGTKGSRLEISQPQISGDVNLNTTNQDYGLLLDMGPSTLVISADDGDGFLQEILPKEGIRADFDLAIGWSNKMGLYFRGSAGLDAELPVNKSLFGLLSLNSVHLSLKTDGGDIQSFIAASVSMQLGPVVASVEGIGLKANFSFPDAGGNLGLMDLSLGFKPPTGVGLAIDAGVVVGGGFLHFDPQKGEYSGILDLQIAEKIAVKAIGLLTTRMPDGSKGYSLLIIITAEGFGPIPLPLGFKLTGIGGLLAVNRTFAEDALRSGLKNHALDSVMFPKDPIRNAPQILSNLNKIFPTATGHYLFGPMVQIQWGTPTLVTAQVAVVLEFGTRLRLLVLAQIAAILPKPDNDLIRLQMDAVGVVDFDEGTASLDATLHDSRLLKKFVLTGDMALRLKWSAPPNFALAVGGLHPAFNPPPNFPKLERIAISLAAGDNPRIRCEAYFALTGSSIQYGARAELYASAAGFTIQGEIGYDVLIQRDPFAFLAEFTAMVQLKRGSTSLFMIKVDGALAGPRPLNVKAKATFEVLWWDVSIRVDRTLVEGEKPPLAQPVDVLPRLMEALGQPGSWTAGMPAGQRPVVVLRNRPGAAGVVQLHPLGKLTVSQNIVPLDMDISRFGDAVPAGDKRFTIQTVSAGWQTLQAVREFFAPAQFFEMSDADKLSRPSFESMPAGVSLGSEGFSVGGDGLEVPAIQFETIIVGEPQSDAGATPPVDGYQLSSLLLGKQARFGAAANSALRHTGTAKYRTTEGKHQIAKKGWSIVSTDDLKVQAVSGIEGAASYSEAEQALHKLKQQDPAKASSLKILRLFEVQGSE